MALLTPEDVANKYNVSLSSLKTNFPRTQATIAKKYGIQLEKIGRGKNAAYQIIDFTHVDPDRALTLYESLETNLIPTTIAAKLLDISFLVFIGIVSSPQRSFRGSYTDLLKYLELDITVENIDIMRIILNQLQDNDYIMYMEDKSDPMYFMAAVQRKTETDMDLEIKAILYFKKIVENTKKSWIPLMKTYLALHFIFFYKQARTCNLA